MLEDLKISVCDVNLELVKRGAVIYTWGNVSGISSDGKYMVIKPSGVEYDKMSPDDMVVGCWYQMRRNQHGRKNCNSIE